MRIGIPRESRPGETLVAATAKTAAQLAALGYDVVVEQGAGAAADQPDATYADAGVRLGTGEEVWASDVVVKVNAPADDEVARLRPGATVISLMAPARSPELVERLAAAGVTALAMDAVPRISRAQSMDVLSSMANVAGYRAVIEAAHEFGRLFTGQVTAAGKVPPARVFVVGAGVAGLAAIGAAGSLGAVVRAFDVRPEVAEQVRSMGADFVTVEMEQEVSTDGYAKEMTAEQEAATAAMYDEEARAADIVITTALIPGRPAPQLVTAETVAAMRPGSVVVDMAAANGGNVSATVPDQRVVTANGVTVLGYTDLAGRLAAQTSQLYGTNVANLLKLLTPEKDGRLVLDMDDVVQRGIAVTRDGAVMWPPPPVQVSAATTTQVLPAAAAAPPPTPVDPRRKWYAAGLGAVAFAVLASLAPASFLGHFTVFALAVVVGYYVISNVSHALHTPLMAETNAISGIILVGGILQVGSDNVAVMLLALVAVFVASINIFGGFLVTLRMLEMFRKD
ncbi:Re/Si-specific NAD(P)(+) transhydrogenase subunit alpha [Nocardioides sp. S-58]|uniref:proton-translocating NAD(P)(+) transhydrogenase n=1 Tax=Nocardioides renjunii TaxID=3095075 RepID=A0ABU5KAU4_9ACTN|nr:MULTISPECIES: Re/Si-specific NAD(P)(+) transhydrogenase subunit alpha [unclassified Nocardioides]MDZ5661554.1 Re/Si-specific NAD(P)(+) transhydrogenase subunit alpha [Nocardioides sp. S-58]WQQ22552.1 Re/Si-specific NAD(P)(+) transhydrogenase subunit alpha [Nocardioides sp. S-34]